MLQASFSKEVLATFVKAVAETKGDHEGAHRRCKRITWAVLSGSCPRGVQRAQSLF